MFANDRVWYVAYGSNTSTDRLMVYLRGGRLGARTYPGARDPRPPRLSRGVRIRGAVSFAGSSGVWGGGVAYLDPAAPGAVPAVAHLITASQLVDVVAQECGLDGRLDLALDLDRLRTGGCLAVHDHPYGTLLHLGDDGGIPVVTFTCPAGDVRPRTTPAPEYLAVIAAGLRAHHSIAPDLLARRRRPHPHPATQSRRRRGA